MDSIHKHCLEVEELMASKTPFVTRYGITLLLVILIVTAIFFFIAQGHSQQLVCDIVKYAFEQIFSKIK